MMLLLKKKITIIHYYFDRMLHYCHLTTVCIYITLTIQSLASSLYDSCYYHTQQVTRLATSVTSVQVQEYVLASLSYLIAPTDPLMQHTRRTYTQARTCRVAELPRLSCPPHTWRTDCSCNALRTRTRCAQALSRGRTCAQLSRNSTKLQFTL